MSRMRAFKKPTIHRWRGYYMDDIIQCLWLLAHQSGSQKEAAKVLGITPQYLNDILHGNRKPGKKLLAALGLWKPTVYALTNPPDTERGE